MAAETENDQALKAHERSYNLFSTLMKWGAIVSLAVTFLIVLIIRN